MLAALAIPLGRFMDAVYEGRASWSGACSCLAQSARRVLTHKQILAAVWGSAVAGQSHTVRVHVAGLRKKIEDDPARPRRLLTEPGVGYRLRDREPD